MSRANMSRDKMWTLKWPIWNHCPSVQLTCIKAGFALSTVCQKPCTKTKCYHFNGLFEFTLSETLGNSLSLDIFPLRWKTECLPEINLNRGIASWVFLPNGANVSQLVLRRNHFTRTSRAKRIQNRPWRTHKFNLIANPRPYYLQLYIYAKEWRLISRDRRVHNTNKYFWSYVRQAVSYFGSSSEDNGGFKRL